MFVMAFMASLCERIIPCREGMHFLQVQKFAIKETF
jgi:hypothetical protein